MKSTGIVRRIDDLGRIVLPKELRTMLGVSEGDSLEIWRDGESVTLRRYQSSCFFCGSTTKNNLAAYKGKVVCDDCAIGIQEGRQC